MRKPILCLDFDGVIHSYDSGWQGAAIIPDPPVSGALEFIHGAIEHFDVSIFSSRSNQAGGIDAMRGWLRMQFQIAMDDVKEVVRVMDALKFPTDKPPAMVTIDDRALCFDGAWPSFEALKAFKPWNKRS